MEIEQSFRVPFTPQQVWRCFHDTEGIVVCLPGAALTAPAVDGQLKLSMTVKLGPIVAAFAGEGAMRLDDAVLQGSVSGAGSDRKSGSRVKGEAAFSLHDESSGSALTRVDVKVDFSITGALAQFSRGGIVRDLAERMTAAFSDNLKKKLEAETTEAVVEPVAEALALQVVPVTVQAAGDGAVAAPAPVAARAPLPATAPLELGGLFWQMLGAWFRRLLRLPVKKNDTQ